MTRLPFTILRPRHLSLLRLAAALCLLAPIAPAQTPEAPGTLYDLQIPPLSNNYPLTADSQPHANVPPGKLFTFQLTGSKVFPNTARTISVYIPAAYNASKPACLYVSLDSLTFSAAAAFDNLIAQHAVPVLIGIGISAGEVTPASGPGDARFDRSFEFDSRNGRLARFILDEVIPAVASRKTPSGDPILLSPDPNDRAIAGGSTGGIAAFNVAWNRPDAFRRVFTAIGTFVGMRGAEQLYVEVRKTEPKPIRIFMTDGAHDEWGGGPEMGDWFLSNLTMERALAFAGYDVNHAWGDNNHNGNLAAQIFPSAMRWLWRDYPTPIAAQPPGNPRLQEILAPGQTWLPASSHPDFAANRVVRFNGDIYETNPAGELWLIRRNGVKRKLDTGLKGPAPLAFTPDGNWLFVAPSHSRAGLSYRVLPDGTLDAREPLYHFHIADNDPTDPDTPETASLAYDTLGHAFAATRAGVQIFDRNGRVIAILPTPDNDAATGLTFGGPDLSTLYVATASGKTYARRLQVKGYAPSSPPIKLPKGSAG